MIGLKINFPPQCRQPQLRLLAAPRFVSSVVGRRRGRHYRFRLAGLSLPARRWDDSHGYCVRLLQSRVSHFLTYVIRRLGLLVCRLRPSPTVNRT